ncbi:hypothetical protein [Nannocystis pusilla]|uniref:hypothetical protein n=1 Tax=Nannocystis pusilla TaxID=889268 RepID=UPI003B7EDAEE
MIQNKRSTLRVSPRIPLPLDFHLAAVGMGEIEVHAEGPSVALIATLPYPVGTDGVPRPLPHDIRGLRPLDPGVIGGGSSQSSTSQAASPARMTPG